MLRQPLEEKCIHLARQQGAYLFPADFILVAAMNPCPCGQYPDHTRCMCTQSQIKNYLGKISQPFLDRIDICMEAPKVQYEDLSKRESGWNSSQMRKQVMAARERQKERFCGCQIRTNAQMQREEIQKYCRLSKSGEEMMRQAYDIMNLTVRSYYKILKVARTIADLEGKEEVDLEALKEATGYRMIDKEYWGY